MATSCSNFVSLVTVPLFQRLSNCLKSSLLFLKISLGCSILAMKIRLLVYGNYRYVYMNVFMYVSMYLCVYICMCSCIYVYMYIFMYVCMYV